MEETRLDRLQDFKNGINVRSVDGYLVFPKSERIAEVYLNIIKRLLNKVSNFIYLSREFGLWKCLILI